MCVIARPTVELLDDVVGDEEEGGAGVEDGGVAGALLLRPPERPRQRIDLPEALRAVWETERVRGPLLVDTCGTALTCQRRCTSEGWR